MGTLPLWKPPQHRPIIMPEIESERDRDRANLRAILVPGLPPAKPRETATLTVRLSPPLKTALQQAAAAQGLSLSDYARLKLADGAMPVRRCPRPPVSDINRQVFIELNRIGVNLNQRLRQLHRQDSGDFTQQDRQLLQHVLLVLGDMQQQIMGASPTQPDERA